VDAVLTLERRSSVVECRPAGTVAGCAATAYIVDNQVGEAPVWDAARQCLWWIDVRAPELLRLDPATAEVERWRLPEPVGALALRADGCLLLALRNHAWLFDPATETLAVFAAVETNRPGNRLNDGKVSNSGRWWLVGSMDDRLPDKQASGALYRIDAQGQVLRLHEGLTIANGLAWSLDGSRLYFSDSPSGQIWQAPWDEAHGTMGALELFATSLEAAGRPDGALVDAQDRYLSAGVSAGCLNRFDASGQKLDTLALPCRAPTMPCYGGASGHDLFVTSLVRPHWNSAAGSADGQLYRLAWFGTGKRVGEMDSGFGGAVSG